MSSNARSDHNAQPLSSLLLGGCKCAGEFPKTTSRVTVITSVYDGNAPLDVADAILSIQRQSLGRFEYLILKDGLGRGFLWSMLSSFAACDDRIRLLCNGDCRGIPFSLNRLIRAAHTEYVAMMDADDVSAVDRLLLQVKFLDEHSEVDAVGSAAIEIDRAGEAVFEKRMPLADGAIRRFLAVRDPMVHPSVVFRRSFFDRVGYYSEAPCHSFVEDTELWSRALFAGCTLANLPEKLYFHRRNDNFFARRRGWQYAWKEWRIRVRYIRQSRLPSHYLLWPCAAAIVRMSPVPILKLAYKYCR